MASRKVQPIATDPERLLLERGLPCNLDAEKLVLGSTLLDDSTFSETAGVLEASDFILEKHRRIFQRMAELFERGERIDRVTVANELTRHGQLESVDGISYLVSLDDRLPHIANLESYVRIVKEKALSRAVIFELDLRLKETLSETDPPGVMLDRIIAGMEAMRAQSVSCGQSIAAIPTIGECGAVGIEYLHEPELPCGCVVAFTGDSGSGKSTLACFFAGQVTAKGVPALVLDRENPRGIVAERLERLGIADGPMLKYSGGWLASGVPPPDSAVVVTWVKACIPKPLVVVDSLAAFHGGDENDAGQMRAFTDRCRRLAELGATVLLIHHDGKADTAREYRGSSDFKASIDQAFHISNFGAEGKLGLVRMRPYKSRLGLASEIVYHYCDGRFIRGHGHDAPKPAVDQFLDLLRNNPGCSARDFDRLASERRLSRDKAREWLNSGVLAGTIRREHGKRNERCHFLIMEAQDAD